MVRKRLLSIGAAAIVGASATVAWLIQGPEFPSRDFSGLEGDVNRGAYIARLSGCIGCHTDIKKGDAVLAGGAEIKTDFGSFYPPNITPDKQSGIGEWSLTDFSRAVTAGRNPDGIPYFPSFPYTFYSRLNNQDIIDLWAAVQSVPPSGNQPPQHDMRFPFGFHQGAGFWQRLFFTGDKLEPRKDKSPDWNRGRYIAEGPAHCAACHTPRNLLGGRISGQEYTGGTGPGKEKIPPITRRSLVKNNWSIDDLAYALRSGIKPDGDLFGGSMAEVVKDGSRYWSNEDLKALSTYIFDTDFEK